MENNTIGIARYQCTLSGVTKELKAIVLVADL